MTEQDAVAADELKRFSQQLVHKAQFKSFRSFEAGSYVELPNNYPSMGVCGMKMDTEVFDITFYLSYFFVFPLTQRVHVEYNGRVLEF